MSLVSWLGVSACGSAPIKAVERVDIPRYVGDWYVLAHIPTSIEKSAWNAVESYRLKDGTQDVIEVTFRFRSGAFDAPLETLHATGYVDAKEPSRWGMNFYWWQGPIRFEYVIVDLDADYREVVIGRSARDYVWVMARTPVISDSHWTRLNEAVRKAGYDPAKLRRIPQRWDAAPDISPTERGGPIKKS
jgi:apolipoprotein D and lipocalin family protein